MSLINELINSTIQTGTMVSASFIISLVGGIPLGIFLLLSKHPLLLKKNSLYRCLSFLVNILRSIPFIILMVAVIPITRLIIGTSIGTGAAIIPLSIAAIPFVARIVENALANQNKGLIETGVALGASPLQIIFKFLLPESQAALIRGFTLTLITLIGYSAMAGAVGGGGLGDFAIRYGYERFDTQVMLLTILILIILVQALQWLGDFLAKRVTK